MEIHQIHSFQMEDFKNPSKEMKKPFENRIFCKKCKMYTESVPPVLLSRTPYNDFKIAAQCQKCNKTKARFYGDREQKYFPPICHTTHVWYPYLDNIDGINLFSLLNSIINKT